MEKRIVFTGKQQVSFEMFEPAALGSGMVAVQTICSHMSTGTENIVFNRLFSPGTHWDQWVKYPFHPGYASIGRIVDTAPDVTTLKTGDIVAVRAGHASLHVAQASKCVMVPPELDPQQAVWFALAKIAFMGTLVAEHHLGDSVLVIGAGPVGQMAIRWANAAGAETLIVTDSVAGRLELAKRGGATDTTTSPIADAAKEITSLNHGELPRLVIDSTGNAAVLPLALKLVQTQGRVLLLGDTGTPEKQHLTMDVLTRGVTIVGAHDGHETQKWDGARITRVFFNLARTGRFNLDGLNTHIFKPEQCVEAYETANTKRGETMGILFDWTAP